MEYLERGNPLQKRELRDNQDMHGEVKDKEIVFDEDCAQR
jgi:hypothetical protein